MTGSFKSCAHLFLFRCYCVSEFGGRPLLIGHGDSSGRDSTPQPQAADSTVWADNEPHMADWIPQLELRLSVQVIVMGAELQPTTGCWSA